MDTLRDKKCFITGAASGIGRATARAAAEGNEHLVFTSQDIPIGHWFQRTLGFVYERSMRGMNNQLNHVAQVAPGRDVGT